MEINESAWRTRRRQDLGRLLLLTACGILVNYLGGVLARSLGLPLYLDSIGTVLTAALGGYLPGIAAGYVTNLLLAIGDADTAYYATISVLLAVAAAWLADQGYFKKFGGCLLAVGCLAVIGGGLGSFLTWMIYGMDFGSGVSAPLAHIFYGAGVPGKFLSQLSAGLVLDLLDKAVTVLICALALRLLPERFRASLRLNGWQQAPLSEEQRREMLGRATRGTSLRVKLVALVAAATLLIAVAATAISAVQYHRYTIQEHKELGQGVTSLAASVVDPERVDDYLTRGEAAEGYLETEAMLYAIRESSPDIEYIYVYRILPDGCHVVFDLDTEDLPGGEPGEVVPFDESFAEQIPVLLAGGEIEPLITDDTYGWLLTVYQPVYNAEGRCVCYAAADISMGQLRLNETVYLVRALSLFLGLFILVLVLGLWMAEYSVILPINSMAMTAGTFAYNNETARAESVEHIRALDIRTGDEIESLYHALVRTTEDTVRYIADVQEKNETISHMQHGLILVLADMVESRDECTGDHVKKTAAYVKIILEQMKREGIYAEALTDEFIQDVEDAAPLHDIGKIQVSDILLNKPGKLTDEEFHQMQDHTVHGGEIISHAIALVSDTGYLEEAKNLATYHHERWDGKGYPKGLAGEAIPLGARVMAVADVFDALVSRRSYKPPFTIDKAIDIIREESGTHFDPQVVRAFLDAEQEVRKVAEEFSED